MPHIQLSELAKIPQIDHPNLEGRGLASLTFFVDGEWHLWVPTDAGLIRMKGWPAEGFYFAVQPESEKDGYLHFLDFIAQIGNSQGVSRPMQGLMEDFFNLSGCMKKFDLLFEYSKKDRSGVSRLVITELEYLFTVCKSIFDLLQEVVAAQWQNIKLLDGTKRKRQLPETFAAVALEANRLRTEDELVARFLIPKELAAFYVRSGAFFQILRTFRDKFVHGGNSPQFVFVTERGFAVQASTKPFSLFNIWNEEHRLPNDLCSLRPAIAYLVNETLKACEDYAATIQTVIKFPPPVCPGLNFFMRGHFNEQLLVNDKVLRECLWWEDAQPIIPQNLSRQPSLDETAFHLFKLFAQYEYALKAMGFVKASHGDRAEPDWNRFIGQHGHIVMNTDAEPVVRARMFLLEAPPKRQIVLNGSIEWADVSNQDKSAQALFGHIRRVRNNLYHGGKFNGRWFAPDRSRPLMESAIVVLGALRDGLPALEVAIRENAA